MSSVKDRLKLWNLPRDLWRQLARVQNRDISPPHGSDRAESCLFGADYWNNYPIRDYRYTYNSWGCRSNIDYETLSGQEVIVCLGDSLTINIGGPIEHSWPSLLSKKFDIPVVNLGIDALCYYHYSDIVTKAREYFKIRHIFVLYNLLERSDRVNNLLKPVNVDIDTKINALKKHFWVQGSVSAFDPPWGFHPEELPILYRHFPNCHDYLKSVKLDYTTIDPLLIIKNVELEEKYRLFSGSQWPRYDVWATRIASGIDPLLEFKHPRDRLLVSQLLNQYIHPYLLRNRDGFHMSLAVNQSLADYFYQQVSI